MKPLTVVITDYGFKHVEQEPRIVTAAGGQLQTAQCRTPGEVLAAGENADALLVQWAPVTAEKAARGLGKTLEKSSHFLNSAVYKPDRRI